MVLTFLVPSSQRKPLEWRPIYLIREAPDLLYRNPEKKKEAERRRKRTLLKPIPFPIHCKELDPSPSFRYQIISPLHRWQLKSNAARPELAQTPQGSCSQIIEEIWNSDSGVSKASAGPSPWPVTAGWPTGNMPWLPSGLVPASGEGSLWRGPVSEPSC